MLAHQLAFDLHAATEPGLCPRGCGGRLRQDQLRVWNCVTCGHEDYRSMEPGQAGRAFSRGSQLARDLMRA